ncbi:unnamed protein product [Periconia digitata]|uniref:Uncharacterized protein n=1 Tax=Periconia digitata TaxID=1303443 RepID=A0A9W4XM14_9PLEO|nr:unnamed protein product [Periconia digitata]
MGNGGCFAGGASDRPSGADRCSDDGAIPQREGGERQPWSSPLGTIPMPCIAHCILPFDTQKRNAVYTKPYD